jgi:RNA polymerase sigma-70 factor (ECF subfamily)
MAVTDVRENETLSDEEIIGRVRAGDKALYEIIMRRYNQRLYRVARAILHNEAEAEDVMQDAYVRAYTHLHQFAFRSSFATWLTRIAVNEALSRRRSNNRRQQLDPDELDEDISMTNAANHASPELEASSAELRTLLEQAILDLPGDYRTVIVLRDVEELSTAETADALDITEENVKIRLHRGHKMIRGWLLDRVGAGAKEAFPFMGERCDLVVERVLTRLGCGNS